MKDRWISIVKIGLELGQWGWRKTGSEMMFEFGSRNVEKQNVDKTTFQKVDKYNIPDDLGL